MKPQADHPADEDSDQATDAGERDGLGQELPDDVGLTRADSTAHADLFRALGHTDQHDIHYADAADQKSCRREWEDDIAGDRGELGDDFKYAARRADAEVVGLIA